ncbi:MAG: GldG family protein [Spirochaetaceae bacterium]|nr:GldG family protein [Spirochaetaceae bacterium]
MKLFDVKLKQAAYSLLMTGFVLAALFIINLITETVNLKLDMTERGVFSLSDETAAIVQDLKNDVTIYALFKQGHESKQIVGILDQYSAFKKLKVKIIDPDRNPALLTQFQVGNETIATGSIIVQSGSYWQVINEIDLYSIKYSQEGPQILGLKVEEKITSAIAYVKTGRKPDVYEITGHNELALKNSDIGKEIESSNFKLNSFNITSSSGIPEEAEILILIGPQRDFTEYESEKLSEYMKNGGKLFAALGYNETNLDNLYSVLKNYDVQIQKGLTMERDTTRLLPEFGDNPFFFAPIMSDHFIADFVKNNQLDPFFSGSMGLTRTESEKRNIQFKPILTTSDNSWLRTDMTRQDDVLLNTDIPGPIYVALSINETNRDTGMETGARLVVIGSPTIFTPLGNMGILPGNIKLLIGSLTWLDNNIQSVSIPTKSLYALPLKIDTKTALLYGLLVSIIIPLSIIITAFIIYRKRKNL